MTRYLINEVYACLQGEGPRLGTPSVLVRFQICNLRCSWCDTPYTHTLSSDPLPEAVSLAATNAQATQKPDKPARPKQKFFSASATQLATRIREKAGPIRHLILSGGEPTLYPLVPVLRELGDDYTAEVESNGTIIPHVHHKGFHMQDYNRFQWNISPKGENAGCSLNTEAIEHWAQLARESVTNRSGEASVTFKWVVRSSHFRQDTQEILNLVERFSISPNQVVLMPEGTSKESQVNSACIALAQFCQTQGMRYSPRLHVLLFGPERGR
jgi:7-carboxy-7-deazaguanine synthase